MITGPTFEEMLHPAKIAPDIRQRARQARKDNPLDPINLFNITWRDENDEVYHVVLPPELTGVEAPIVVITAQHFPSGSHKVGPAYSCLLEKELFGEVDPSVNTLVWPSTGNYGIGGAWVGGRMGCNSIVVLPEGISRERFEMIESYGASINKTTGSESNVKEIYDETHRLSQDPNVRIINQFSEMGNYRFHYHVTGNSIAELAGELAAKGGGDLVEEPEPTTKTAIAGTEDHQPTPVARHPLTNRPGGGKDDRHIGRAFGKDLRPPLDEQGRGDNVVVAVDRRPRLDRQGGAVGYADVPAERVQGIGVERPIGGDAAGDRCARSFGRHGNSHFVAEAAL